MRPGGSSSEDFLGWDLGFGGLRDPPRAQGESSETPRMPTPDPAGNVRHPKTTLGGSFFWGYFVLFLFSFPFFFRV